MANPRFTLGHDWGKKWYIGFSFSFVCLNLLSYLYVESPEADKKYFH